MCTLHDLSFQCEQLPGDSPFYYIIYKPRYFFVYTITLVYGHISWQYTDSIIFQSKPPVRRIGKPSRS